MIVRELIELLDQYPDDMQVFVLTSEIRAIHSKDLHIPEVTMYDMDNIPEILVIS